MGLLVSGTVSHIFQYPFITIMRRLHCQDELPGMIPRRYEGWFHALKLIIKEEGVRGIYRGFMAYAVVVSCGCDIDRGEYIYLSLG